MEGEISYVSIFKNFNTLNFVLDAHYNSSKVKIQFQLSVYCNAHFLENQPYFHKFFPVNKLIIGINF